MAVLLAFCLSGGITTPTGLYARHLTKDRFFAERLLPKSTLAVCAFPDVETTIATLQHTEIHQELFSGITSLIETFQRNSDIQDTGIQAMFRQSVAIALLDVFPRENDTEDEELPAPEFVLITQISDSIESVKEILETRIIKAVQQQEPTIEFGVKSVRGNTIYMLSNTRFQLAYTFINHACIVARHPETLQKMMEVSSNESLIEADSFHPARTAAERYGHDIRLYINIKHIWQKLRPSLRQQCEASQSLNSQILFDLFDQYPLRTVTWLFSLQENGGYERIIWEIPRSDGDTADSTLLLHTLQHVGNGTLTSDQLIPPHVRYYRAGRVDVSQLWQSLVNSIDHRLPVPQQEQFHAKVSQIEDLLQLDLKQELFPAFGQECAVACAEVRRRNSLTKTRSPLENFPCFLLLQIAQPDVIRQLLHTLSETRLTTQRFQGTTVYKIEVPGAILSIPVYAVFVRDFLVLSVSRTHIESILSVAVQGGSLASTQEYRNLSAHFPEHAYAKGYIDLRRLLRRLETGAKETLIDKTIENQSVSGLMWVTTVHEQGFLTESFSTIGGTLTVPAIVLFKAVLSGYLVL